MNVFAEVRDGKVVGLLRTRSAPNENFVQLEGWDESVLGAAWDGASFTPAPAPSAVPQRVTARQAVQALILAGLIGQVQPAIDAIQDPLQRALVQAEWDRSQEFERNRPTLIALATAIGLTSEQLDQLFVQAAQL